MDAEGLAFRVRGCVMDDLDIDESVKAFMDESLSGDLKNPEAENEEKRSNGEADRFSENVGVASTGNDDRDVTGEACHPDAADALSDESEKVKALEAEVSGLKDRMIRLQADTENYRKRLIREKEDAVVYANERLIRDLLEFFDNLDRVLQAGRSGGDAQSLCKGIELMQNQLFGTLSKNWGLTRIETSGKEFNPEEHEAVMMESAEGIETEMVSQEFQAGYRLHGRVVRPAKVKVAKPV